MLKRSGPRSGSALVLVLGASLSVLAQAPSDRLPPPSDAQQAESEKRIRQTFKDQYAKRDPESILALASALMKAAAESQNDTAMRFVLLREARELAIRAGDLGAAYAAIDQMAMRYTIKPLEMKLDALAVAGRLAVSQARSVTLAESCLSLLPQAIAEDSYPAALRLLQIAGAAVQKAKQKELIAQVQTADKETRYLQKEYEQMKLAQAKLISKPQDAEANMVVGRYLCLAKGDLERALTHLSRGGDSTLRAAAEKELQKPADPAAQITLADLWRKASLEKGNFPKEVPTLAYRWNFTAREFQKRALRWYESALPKLAGQEKQAVSLKVQELSTVQRTAAGGGSEGRTGEDLPEKALLVGFRFAVVATGAARTIQVSAVQAVFQTPQGRLLGALHGPEAGPLKEVLAKPGYAVGAILARGATRLNGFRVTFSRVAGARLDPEDSYETEWCGGTAGSPDKKLGGAGNLVVGIHTREWDDLHALGLVLGP